MEKAKEQRLEYDIKSFNAQRKLEDVDGPKSETKSKCRFLTLQSPPSPLARTQLRPR